VAVASDPSTARVGTPAVPAHSSLKEEKASSRDDSTSDVGLSWTRQLKQDSIPLALAEVQKQESVVHVLIAFTTIAHWFWHCVGISEGSIPVLLLCLGSRASNALKKRARTSEAATSEANTPMVMNINKVEEASFMIKSGT